MDAKDNPEDYNFSDDDILDFLSDQNSEISKDIEDTAKELIKKWEKEKPIFLNLLDYDKLEESDQKDADLCVSFIPNIPLEINADELMDEYQYNQFSLFKTKIKGLKSLFQSNKSKVDSILKNIHLSDFLVYYNPYEASLRFILKELPKEFNVGYRIYKDPAVQKNIQYCLDNKLRILLTNLKNDKSFNDIIKYFQNSDLICKMELFQTGFIVCEIKENVYHNSFKPIFRQISNFEKLKNKIIKILGKRRFLEILDADLPEEIFPDYAVF